MLWTADHVKAELEEALDHGNELSDDERAEVAARPVGGGAAGGRVTLVSRFGPLPAAKPGRAFRTAPNKKISSI